jgi:ubiquinone/menaquinone biosynthesis C-methylase UbiE
VESEDDMNATELVELAKLKQGARSTWAAGDYGAVAQRQLWEVGERIVRRVGVLPGEDVLDIACGTGNAAIRAAQAGGRVVGVDLTPELFADAGRLADEARVKVEWVQGDAEALPCGDDSFDIVLSTFGCMFAPRHHVAAAEIARVLRPGGGIGITAWRPDGPVAEFFRSLGEYLPPPSPLAQPPTMWGSEAHAAELFAGTGIELTFEHDSVEAPQFESAEESVDFFTSNFGPLMVAKEHAEASGRWPELHEKLVEFHAREEAAEYLVILGRKAL